MKKIILNIFRTSCNLDCKNILINKREDNKKTYKAFVKTLFLSVILFLFGIVNSKAQTTVGPNNTGTGANMTGIGTITWTNPTNIYTSNNSRATITLGSNITSNYLRASNFGFSIPTDAIILGVSVNIERLASGSGVRDNVVSLVNSSGTIVGNNKAVTGTNWPTTEAVTTYGGVADIWGTSLTAADINSSNFGVVLAVYNNNNSNNRTASVDHITISVTYSLPPANDACSSATSLPCGTSNLAGTTVNSVAETAPGTCVGTNGVWYSFAGDGQYTTISAFSSMDIGIYIASGTCASRTQLECIDGFFGNATETSTNFLTLVGTNYYVYIANFEGSTTGNFTISRTCPSPSITTSVSSLTAFSACANTASSQQSFTVSGSNLTANLVVTPPTGFEISSTSGSGFGTSAINLAPSSGSVASTTIYVRMASQASSPSNGNIVCSSTGATNKNVAVSGSVANTAATATTGVSSSITGTSATLAGSYVANCQTITGYGIFYSTTNGFANGTGTQVSSSNQSSGSFTSSVSGLNSSTTYYYKAYATNASGTTVYGSQSSFTTLVAPPSNDDCSNAISLTVNTSCSYAIYTNANATASSDVTAPSCASYSGGDVWFSFVVPANGTVTIDSQAGVMTDSGMAWYTGTCGSLTELECDDDDSSNGAMSTITRTGLTPGDTIYVRFWEYDNNGNGTFGICASTPPACSGTPAPGNTVTSAATVVSGGTVNLSLQNATSGTGVTYQWQSAPTSTGTWTNFGTSSATQTTPAINANTWYRCIVTCSGSNGTSTPVEVTILQGNNCDSVQDLALLSSPFSDTTVGYSNSFTNSCLNGTGGDRIFKIDVPNGGQLFIGQSVNGYDSKHRIAYGGTCPGTTEINTGYLGNLPTQTTNGTNSGCVDDDDLTHYYFNNNTGSTQTVYWIQDGFSTGEGTFTLEWELIQPSDPITITPSGSTTICNGNSVDLTASSSAAYTYTWSPSTGLNTTSGATVIASPTSTTTYTVTGTQGATTITNTITITVNPAPTDVVITASDATVCKNTVQALTATGGTFTNASIGASSGTVNLTIPDGNLTTGASQNLTVSGIPANATITKVDVLLNITHTYLGDLRINLEAPNGQIINLINQKGGISDNFTNTIVTSNTGAASLSTGSAPFTGTFTADIGNQTTIGTTPAVTTTTFSNLFATPNGTWKVRVYDDESIISGTLNNCSITITYDGGVITWSPTTDLYTNATCTAAYSGGHATNLWSKPTATRTYTATSTLGSCEKTDTVTLTVESATYNGSWSSAPAANKELVFNGDFSSTESLEGCSCTITSGNIVINSNHTLKLLDEITVNGGSMTFENNSSLIQINDVANTGNITYKRTSPQTVEASDYVYWSSPVSGQTVPSGTNYFWNNAAGSSGNWVSAVNQPLTAGKGVIMRGVGTRNLTGIPFNGVINVGVFKRNLAGYSDNWNLIGNPYPSAISADEFLADLDNAAIEGSIAIWTHNSPISSTNPDPFYNNFTYNYNPNDYIIYNLSGSQLGPDSYYGFIPAGQAFFVKYDNDDNASPTAASSTIKFKNSMRLDASGNTYNNSQFYRNSGNVSQNIEKSRIWIDIINGSNAFNRTLVGYIENATDGKDRLFDATTGVKTAVTSIYSLIGNNKMGIQGKGLPFMNSDIIPLGFNAAQAGNLTIAIHSLDGLFVNQEVYLLDTQLNIIHDIKLSPYTFTTTQGENNSRFQLIFNNETLSNPDFDAQKSVFIVNENKLEVISNLEQIEAITVFDLLGRTIYMKDNINNKEFVIPVSKENAPLIVKIKLANGTNVERKTLY